MQREVKIGHTNAHKYVEGEKFVLQKTTNGFNHRLEYKNLKVFDFVPQLIKVTEEQLIWEYIPSTMVKSWSDDDLIQMAAILRKIHTSTVNLPKNNFRQRINFYLKQIHAKGLRPPVVEANYKEMFKLMANMKNNNPCHNDLWYENIIKDNDNKLWLVDWEYATMGDRHFDLAFFVESCRLDHNQEQLLLKTYNSFDDHERACDPSLLPRYKRFAHYITICWAYAQPSMPFNIKPMEEYLIATKKKSA